MGVSSSLEQPDRGWARLIGGIEGRCMWCGIQLSEQVPRTLGQFILLDAMYQHTRRYQLTDEGADSYRSSGKVRDAPLGPLGNDMLGVLPNPCIEMDSPVVVPP